MLFDKDSYWPHAATERLKRGSCKLRCMVRIKYKADAENSGHKTGCKISH